MSSAHGYSLLFYTPQLGSEQKEPEAGWTRKSRKSRDTNELPVARLHRKHLA